MKLLQETEELVKTLGTLGEHSERLALFAEKIAHAFLNGGKVIAMGNGGSAADAQHIAAEFVGRYNREREGLPALALNTNTSTITSIGNDYAYDKIFSRQVEAFARPGDVVIAISTSGNSPNVAAAVEAAKKRGCFVVALLGRGGGTLKAMADLPIVVASDKTPRIQECHIHMAHIVCGMVEDLLAKAGK